MHESNNCLIFVLSITNQETLNLLNGCEVNSLNYEGVVYISGKNVYQDGNVIDTLDANDKIEDLWDEYLVGEGIR